MLQFFFNYRIYNLRIFYVEFNAYYKNPTTCILKRLHLNMWIRYNEQVWFNRANIQKLSSLCVQYSFNNKLNVVPHLFQIIFRRIKKLNVYYYIHEPLLNCWMSTYKSVLQRSNIISLFFLSICIFEPEWLNILPLEDKRAKKVFIHLSNSRTQRCLW